MITAFRTSLLTALLMLAMTPAFAVTLNELDLDHPGDHGTINGAIFYREDPNPTGTGNINSFLRIQSNTGTERGYNTDGTPRQFNEKGGNFTHSLLLNKVGKVSFDGGTTWYREFMLDVAESDNQLILTDLKIYLEPVGDLLGWPDTFGTALYDLDTATVDGQVNLIASPGNGRGDMYVYIPDALFTNSTNSPYVYLYSRFTQCDGSFEEWSTQETDGDDPPTVPEPMSLSLLGLGLGLGALIRRRMTR